MDAKDDRRVVRSLIYTSRSLLPLPDGLVELDALVETSRSRNAQLDVTGALIFSERHFAQWLEGPPAAIDALMLSIGRDGRHADLRVVKDIADVPRRFTGWSLAYWGTATFVDRLIVALEKPVRRSRADDDIAVRRLEEVIYQFATQGGGRTLGR